MAPRATNEVRGRARFPSTTTQSRNHQPAMIAAAQKRTQESPKTAPRQPKRAQDNPKRTQESPKTAPRQPQESPRQPQDSPRELQDQKSSSRARVVPVIPVFFPSSATVNISQQQSTSQSTYSQHHSQHLTKLLKKHMNNYYFDSRECCSSPK